MYLLKCTTLIQDELFRFQIHSRGSSGVLTTPKESRASLEKSTRPGATHFPWDNSCPGDNTPRKRGPLPLLLDDSGEGFFFLLATMGFNLQPERGDSSPEKHHSFTLNQSVLTASFILEEEEEGPQQQERTEK